MNNLNRHRQLMICSAKVVMLCLLINIVAPNVTFAESSTNYEIVSSSICSGGVPVASSNYSIPRSTIGDVISSTSASSTAVVSSGYISQVEELVPIVDEAGGTLDIEVTGTIDDNDATVDINGVQAQVSNNAFSATIPLVEGPNSIVATATDSNSNQAQKEITVYLDTKPPSRPTLRPVKTPTPISQQTLSGTKEADTSIWINGEEVVPLDVDTTWLHEVQLNSGDNSFSILSKDRARNESTAVTTNITLNPEAPTVTIDSPADGAHTNLLLIDVSGTVNDASAEVQVNDVVATVAGTTFTAEAVQLKQRGPNIITATASSGGHTSRDVIIIFRDRLPVITSFTPPDGAKYYEEEDVQCEIEADDLDGDLLEYQFVIDGVVKQGWSAATTYTWSTSKGDSGQHTLVGEVRDGYGGKASDISEIYLYVEPVALPTQ